jgi:hypothetical protein
VRHMSQEFTVLMSAEVAANPTNRVVMGAKVEMNNATVELASYMGKTYRKVSLDGRKGSREKVTGSFKVLEEGDVGSKFVPLTALLGEAKQEEQAEGKEEEEEETVKDVEAGEGEAEAEGEPVKKGAAAKGVSPVKAVPVVPHMSTIELVVGVVTAVGRVDGSFFITLATSNFIPPQMVFARGQYAFQDAGRTTGTDRIGVGEVVVGRRQCSSRRAPGARFRWPTGMGFVMVPLCAT